MGLLKESSGKCCDCETPPETSPPESSPRIYPVQNQSVPKQQTSHEMSRNLIQPKTLDSGIPPSVQIRIQPLANSSTTELSEKVPNTRSTVCSICRRRQNALHRPRKGQLSKRTNKQNPSNTSIHPLVKSRLVSSSVNSKVPSQIHTSKVIKKYRKSRLRLVKRQEYKRLREMVPVLQEKDKVSKVEVIEEAIKYIDELHDALVQRFRTRGLPPLLNDVNLDPDDIDGGNIRDLIRRLLASNNPASLPPSRIENVRVTPSFLQKTNRNRKS